jgi:cobaltochelatase CobS
MSNSTSNVNPVIRDRIRARYESAGITSGSNSAAAGVVEAPVRFLCGAPEATAGKLMYSEIAGGKDYLDRTGKSDLDLSELYHEVSDWDVEDRAFIPTVDEHYVWQHDALYPTVLALMGKMKALFVGPTGSGKTTFHQNLAGLLNQPFYRLGGRGDMESDVILGRTIAKGGTTAFDLGEFTKSYTKGYYILLDEIWKLPSNINMTFQRVLERDGLLQIDEAEGDLADKQFRPHANTIIQLADNVVGTGDGADHYGATMIQDLSTLNRVDLVIPLDYLPAEDETNMLASRFSTSIPAEYCRKVVQVGNLIRAAFRQDELSVGMSPRNLVAWLEMAVKMQDYAGAFNVTMVARYADDEEREAVRGMYYTAFAEHC